MVSVVFIYQTGGRQLEFAPSTIEIAYKIYHNAPEVFQQTVTLADSSVCSGTDVLKLLAMGVAAVGMGRW
jgi:L-lactate dehydrogenase (cytochrome)